MGVKRVIVRNILSNWTGAAVAMVVMFFLSPFVVHKLGSAGYGIWVLVGSLTGYFGLLDLGIRPAIVKFTSKYYELQDTDKINEAINSAIVISSMIAFVILIATAIIAHFANNIFKVPPEYHSAIRILVLLVGIKIAIEVPFAILTAVFNGLQRFDLNNVIGISVLLIRSLAIVVILSMGGRLIAMGLILLGAGILETLIRLKLCYKILPTLKLHPRLARKDMLKNIYSFSIYIFLIGLSAQITFYANNLIIGAFLTATAIAYYAIGANLIEYLKNIVAQVTTTVTPVASAFEAREQNERLKNLLLIGTRYCLLIIFPVGIVYLILGERFIDLWMGPEYGPPSSEVLTILMIAYFGFLSQLVSGSILYGLGKVKTYAFLNIGTAAANLLLSLLLVKPYGIIGAALGTAIPLTIYGTFIIPAYICRVLSVNLFTYFKSSFIPAILSSVPFLAAVILIHRLLTINSLTQFMLIIAGAMCLHIISTALIGLDREHRTLLRDKVRLLLAARLG